MVQFNLLPDVKIEYIKTQAKMRIIIAACIVVSGVLLAIFTILFINARVLQTAHSKSVTNDINGSVKKIQSVQDLDKILTIQKQLGDMSTLHDSKIIASRLPDYLNQLKPEGAKYTDLEIDYTAGTFTLKGTAKDLATVNKYVDTLKFTDYKVAGENGKSGKAFSEVVLTSFAIQEKATSEIEKATFAISMKFDTELFKRQKIQNVAEDKAVTLVTPNIISTRSETEKPKAVTTQPQTQGGQQ
jgi:hypothetical protein